MGVMVPGNEIVQRAIDEGCDIIGLSGLITPSLDEMVKVASAMEERKLKIPLLIGGATTSKVHTAVKISPNYSGSVIYVPDASRAVTVAEKLLGGDQGLFQEEVREDYEKVRQHHEQHAASKRLIPIDAARKNSLKLEFNELTIAVPQKLGVFRGKIADLNEIIPYIDWSPFFRSWDLHGKYPDILSDNIVGEEAKKLYKDAHACLVEGQERGWFSPRYAFGIFPAQSVGDDLQILDSDSGKSGVQDYVCCFVVTAGDVTGVCQEFERAHDDYKSILLKAVADRLAEAMAEWLHERVRQEYWGYEQKALSNEELIAEKYRGIRPAPGYPACPDHYEKLGIFELLSATDTLGVSLTESLAMHPASSVSGWYFAHPEAKYFGITGILPDQFESVCERRGLDPSDHRSWFSSILK
jgi:5-methyltetrahydrofolate--homocysteine methyltransferase